MSKFEIETKVAWAIGARAKWGAALTVLAGGVLLGCATIGASGEEDIYYSSQAEADADLARFDADNPDCQLWTNWQKMCSRTGGGGETWCGSDSETPARPSKPFCQIRRGISHRTPFFDPLEGGELLMESSASRESRNRFCAEYWSEADLPKSLRGYRVGFCKRFASQRPFNGLGQGQASHPACGEWGRLDGASLIYCKKFSSSGSCDKMSNSVPMPTSSESGLAIGRNPLPESEAIWGIYCP